MADTFTPRELTGQLHRNARKTAAAQPDHTGSVTVAGTTYRVAAWIKEGAAGRFFSLRLEPIPPTPDKAPKEHAPRSRREGPPAAPAGNGSDASSVKPEAAQRAPYQPKRRIPGEYPEPVAAKGGKRRGFGTDSIPF